MSAMPEFARRSVVNNPALPPVVGGDWAQPLEAFYTALGLALPEAEPIASANMPEPYRSLLVHERDMTSTLEQFHGQPVKLSVLSSHLRENFYFREVILTLADRPRPVEFGAIKIDLSLFPRAARRMILEEQCPLGHILWDCAVPFLSRPQAFLRISADDLMRQRLAAPGAQCLFGRRNRLMNPEGGVLADIVEILPPEGADRRLEDWLSLAPLPK